MPELPAGTVTFLFTDVEGSTRLLHELGDSYADVLTEHRRLLREAFERHRGVEVDTQGDAFFVAFARASDALAAAREAQAALNDPIRVRIGIHTGEPLVTGEGYVGIDVHRAARIAAAGHGGQILVSQSTRDLVGAVGLRDLGEHRLKDLTAPARIYQLGEGEFPPLKSLHRTRLPVATSSLIGRHAELDRIVNEIRSKTRLLTVTGPGGSGKTRLALQAAAELSDDFVGGTYFVSLAPLSESAAVRGAVARALELQPDDDLIDRLQQSPVLLVLDNAEHLHDVAHEVASLRVGETALLVTSRAPLHLSGEHELPLDPLPDADAVALFAARASERGRPIVVDETVYAICRRVDNLPLALELAAARLSVLSPVALLERLDRALPLLTRGASDLPERQQTLRATIEWSYRLLRADVQHVLCRLAVFRGGFELDAAEAVAGATLDAVTMLVEQSLLKHVDDERFLMLETIREFALEELGRDRLSVELSHAEHYLERIRANDEVIRVRLPDFLTWYEEEAANTWAALDTFLKSNRLELAWELADLLGSYWVMTGRLHEGVRLLRGALSAHVDESLQRGRALRRLGDLLERIGASSDSADALEEALRLSLVHGDDENLVHVYNGLAVTALHRDDRAQAVEFARRAVAIAADLHDDRLLAHARNQLAWMLMECGDFDEAERELNTALDYGERVGERANVAMMLGNLAYIAASKGAPEVARAHLQRAREVAPEGSTQLEAHLAAEGSFHELVLGDLPAAARLAGRALELATTSQLDYQAVVAVETLAVVHGDAALYASASVWRNARGRGREPVVREVHARVRGGIDLAGDALPWDEAIARARSLAPAAVD